MHSHRFTRGALVTALISICALSLPLLRGHFPAGHDATAHLTYTYLFDRALAQGQFPVRWIEWVVTGYNQPLFNFYQPGLYYLVSLVHTILPSLSFSLALVIAGLWLVGSMFVFLLARPLGTFPAALGAVVYAFSPYLMLDVFVRSAYPEFAAIAFAPGVLLAVDRLLRAPSAPRLAGLALLAGVMVVCHPPTALIFAPVFVLYASYLLATGQTTPRTLCWLIPGGLLAAGVAAFYIAPALLELHLIDEHALTAGSFDYRLHFVWPAQWLSPEWGYGASVEGTEDGMSFQIGLLQTAVVVVAVCVLANDAARWSRPGAHTLAIVCWLAACALALFLTTPFSAPLWAAVPSLAFVQYPWRFLMVTPVCAGMLAALVLARVNGRATQAAALLACVVLAVQLTHGYLTPGGYILPTTLDIDRQDLASSPGIAEHAFIERAYFPRGVQSMPRSTPSRWTVQPGDGSLLPVLVTGHELILRATMRRAAHIVVHSFMVPGWKVTVDGRDTAVSPDSAGYIRVPVPAGVHTVHAEFTTTPPRFWGNLASVVSLAACVMLLGIGIAQRR